MLRVVLRDAAWAVGGASVVAAIALSLAVGSMAERNLRKPPSFSANHPLRARPSVVGGADCDLLRARYPVGPVSSVFFIEKAQGERALKDESMSPPKWFAMNSERALWLTPGSVDTDDTGVCFGY